MDEPSQRQVPWKKNLSYPTYRGTDGPSHQRVPCLKSLSHPTYRGDGRTKPPTSALVKKAQFILPTGGTNELSHRRVP